MKHSKSPFLIIFVFLQMHPVYSYKIYVFLKKNFGNYVISLISNSSNGTKTEIFSSLWVSFFYKNYLW